MTRLKLLAMIETLEQAAVTCRIVARNGACIALGALLFGKAFVKFAEKPKASLKPETTLIFTLAFAVLKNN
jgi:hypothetical protein